MVAQAENSQGNSVHVSIASLRKRAPNILSYYRGIPAIKRWNAPVQF